MSAEDEEWEGPPLHSLLTVRENRLVFATLLFGLTAGIWVGLWMVPDSALLVPQDEHGAMYQPVPNLLPLGTVLLLGIAGWQLWRATQVDGGRWYDNGETDPDAGGDEA